MSSLLQPKWKQWSTDAVDLSSSPNLASYPGCSLKIKYGLATYPSSHCWLPLLLTVPIRYQNSSRDICRISIYYCIINLSQHIQLALGMTVLFECLLLLCATTTVQYLQTKWFKIKNLFESRVAVWYCLLKVGRIDISERERVYCKRCI